MDIPQKRRGDPVRLSYGSIIVLIIIISSVSAATVSNSFSAQGSGSLMRNTDTVWESGTDSETIAGSSGNVLLTAPGEFQYQTRERTDATVNNGYNMTGYVRFDRGGVGSDSLSMQDTGTGQKAAVEHAYILQAPEISTAKYVSDANLSMGQQAAWDGAGLYTRDLSYQVDLKRETEDGTLYYRTSSSDHAVIFTNLSEGAIVRPEFDFVSFSDAFIFNASINTTEPNQTGSLS